MHLSIEISLEQYQCLKASAALSGQSIRGFVLSRILPDSDEQAALEEFESFLKSRLIAARQGDFSDRSVDDIFNEVEQE